ncbi:hypothetical protein L596_014774 [Steinernema carpocapsae]|uniref:RING-type E3 ubiquitin transferase (cysteine targeting) n=1 Tax=Steinernema carpocapsae TaxID=34508 RepID=A0A4U5ND50_STECR|nr:hypothetical protein L596_014774 [Steinernema carpocapsae]
MTLRVAQIDAEILDSEVEELVSDAVNGFVASLPFSAAIVGERLRPEIRLFIRGILWSHRLLKGHSIGQEFMSLNYSNYDRRRMLVHFFVEAIIPYAAERIADWIPNRNHRLRKLVTKLEIWTSVISLLAHFYFLRNGGFRSLIERFLNLRSTYISPPTLGVMNYDALNRELLWHSFRDLIVLALPLIRLGRQFWRRRFASSKLSSSLNDEWTCARCGQIAVIPSQRNLAVPDEKNEFCPHIFCFYCYTSESGCEHCGKALDEKSMRFVTRRPIRGL